VGINASLVRFLDAQLTPEAVTLETGAGLSTIVILRGGVARHIGVTPYAAAFGPSANTARASASIRSDGGGYDGAAEGLTRCAWGEERRGARVGC
jgi:hypothetical protein